LLPDATVVRTALTAGGVPSAEIEPTTLGLVCRVAPGDAVAALAALQASELAFAMLVDLLGIDTGDEIEIVYHLRSLTRDEEAYVKTALPYDGVLASVWEVYPAALMPERETAELYGLTLSGHPNPKRLLTTDGVPPLLRKSVPVRTHEEMRGR
jgi:NADH:ubiquinone oxidoreductase subunit C